MTSSLDEVENQRKLPKKSLYHRVSVATKFKSSNIQADEVALLFNPEFLNISQKSCRVGNKMIGSSVDEVLEQIMEQLAPVGFKIQEADEFNKIYHDNILEENQQNLKEYIEMLAFVLKDLDIDGKEAAKQLAAYQQAADKVEQYSNSTRKPLHIWRFLKEMFEQLSGDRPATMTYDHSSALQKAMTKHWFFLFNMITNTKSKKYLEFTDNGASQFQFEMDVSPAFLKSTCLPENIQPGPKGDASSSDESTNHITKKKFIAVPDMSGFIREKRSEDKSSSSAKVFFVAEFKGSRSTIKEELSISEKSEGILLKSPTGSLDGSMPMEEDIPSTSKRKSSRLSGGPSKRMKLIDTHANKDEELNTNQMSKHFLDLLCAIKYQLVERQLGSIDKCYGMYCLKHRFHITCLAAVSKHGRQQVESDVSMQDFNKGIFLIAKTPEEFRDDPSFRLRMACTDYLDMTNPVHMEAALKFVSVLGSCNAYI